jgi:hypothetical protein
MKTNDLTGEQIESYWHGMRPTILTRNIPIIGKMFIEEEGMMMKTMTHVSYGFS